MLSAASHVEQHGGFLLYLPEGVVSSDADWEIDSSAVACAEEPAERIGAADRWL